MRGNLKGQSVLSRRGDAGGVWRYDTAYCRLLDARDEMMTMMMIDKRFGVKRWWRADSKHGSGIGKQQFTTRDGDLTWLASVISSCTIRVQYLHPRGTSAAHKVPAILANHGT